MTAKEDLFRSILLNPADTDARLVYADWLEENGVEVERVEFIRIQCRLSTPAFVSGACACQVRGNGTLVYRCELCELTRRERELLDHHWGEWVWTDLGMIVPGPRPFYSTTIKYPEGIFSSAKYGCGGFNECSFDRGFVGVVGCRLFHWMSLPESLALKTPLTGVNLTDREPEFVEDNDHTYYHWLSSGDGWREAEEYLPGKIYKWLPRGKRNRFRWRTKEEAKSAQSIATVRSAREDAFGEGANG